MPKALSLILSILSMYLFYTVFFRFSGVVRTSLHLILIPFLAVIATRIFREDKKGYKIILSSLSCYIIMCVAAWALDNIL